MTAVKLVVDVMYFVKWDNVLLARTNVKSTRIPRGAYGAGTVDLMPDVYSLIFLLKYCSIIVMFRSSRTGCFIIPNRDILLM